MRKLWWLRYFIHSLDNYWGSVPCQPSARCRISIVSGGGWGRKKKWTFWCHADPQQCCSRLTCQNTKWQPQDKKFWKNTGLGAGGWNLSSTLLIHLWVLHMRPALLRVLVPSYNNNQYLLVASFGSGTVWNKVHTLLHSFLLITLSRYFYIWRSLGQAKICLMLYS